MFNFKILKINIKNNIFILLFFVIIDFYFYFVIILLTFYRLVLQYTNRFFIMRVGIFQDITDYEIWKTKSVEQTVEGKRAKHRSDVGLGIRFFKIIIPLEIAQKYESKWLSFVRELKNDDVPITKEYYWTQLKDLTIKERLDLLDIDILKKNLKPKKEKGSDKNN